MISIIITTKNEFAHLPKLLGSLSRQTDKDFETIVVDNHSTDNTKEIAKKFGARVFDKGPERSAQRNFGVQKAKSKTVLILDADMILTPNVIKECNRIIIDHPEKGAFIVPEKSFGTGFWIKYKVFEREFYVGDDDTEAPRLFRIAIFKKFGGYDENITGPEDFDLPLRIKKAGIKFGRIKSFILHDEGKYSPFRTAKKKYYYASKSNIFLKRHPEQALLLGNLVFRPVFFKKWKKMIAHPCLSLGMLTIKMIEGVGAFAGAVRSGII